MRPPTVVTIIGQSYTIAMVDDHRAGLFRSTTPGAVGAVDNDIGIIRVRSTESGDASFHQERDTTLHEIIHALNYSLGIKDKERAVGNLATGLLQVLRENPRLVAYLTESEP